MVPSLPFPFPAGPAYGRCHGAPTSTCGAPGTGERGCLTPQRPASEVFEGPSASSRSSSRSKSRRALGPYIRCIFSTLKVGKPPAGIKRTGEDSGWKRLFAPGKRSLRVRFVELG